MAKAVNEAVTPECTDGTCAVEFLRRALSEPDVEARRTLYRAAWKRCTTRFGRDFYALEHRRTRYSPPMDVGAS